MSELINQWKNQKDSNSLKHKAFLKSIKKRKNLDAVTGKTHRQVFKEVDCLQCANCCKSIPPIVKRGDAKRIAKHLNLSESEFAEKYLLVDEDGDTVINSSPCPFLEADNKCQIYTYRPNACRAYPHTAEYEFMDNLNLHVQNSKYCPAVFHILERLMHKV